MHLNSELAATSLLSVAKKLHMSDNTTIATDVLINPDLSPADAKLALEQRQRKRERKSTRTRHLVYQFPITMTMTMATTALLQMNVVLFLITRL